MSDEIMQDGVETAHFVYAAFDSSDGVLYVGVTSNVNRRLTEHRSKPWWPMVAAVETSRALPRDAAYALERSLIRKHSPEFNTQSVDVVENFMHKLTGPFNRALADLMGEPA